jgi:hypothetical protein
LPLASAYARRHEVVKIGELSELVARTLVIGLGKLPSAPKDERVAHWKKSARETQPRLGMRHGGATCVSRWRVYRRVSYHHSRLDQCQ